MEYLRDSAAQYNYDAFASIVGGRILSESEQIRMCQRSELVVELDHLTFETIEEFNRGLEYEED